MVKSTNSGGVVLALLIAGAQAQTPPRRPRRRRPAGQQTPAKPAKETLRAPGPGTRSPATGNACAAPIKEQWGKLTHNEIRAAQGRRDVLNGYIQTRYGIDREAADKQIDEWLKTLK